MLSKESKIRVLENFYALDYVFFGKPAAKVESCCPLLKEEYVSIKGALMSVFVEMLKLVDHNPNSIEEQVDSKLLMQSARDTAQIARENAQRIVSTDKSRANIKEALKAMIKEDKTLDISATIEGQIRTKAFSLAVDNLLLARVVSEASAFDKLNEWEGTIIEDSYKILRDNLIEAAYEILYTEGVEEDLEEGWKLGALIGLLVPIPGGAIAGGFIGHWMQQNKEKLQAYCSKQKDKAGCMAAGSQAMKAKLQQAQARVKKKVTKEDIREAHKLIKELAKEDGFTESLMLMEKGGMFSAAAAGTFAEWKCGLRGKDRVLKMQLGYRKCFWEQTLAYYSKKVGEYKREKAAKCAKKDGHAKTACQNSMKIKLAKAKRATDNYQEMLRKVNDRIKKKKGKTWKV